MARRRPWGAVLVGAGLLAWGGRAAAEPPARPAYPAAPAPPAADVGADGVRLHPMPAVMRPPPRPCRSHEVPPTLTRSDRGTALNVPPRTQAPGHPPEGWCGETAIQEVLLFHGAWFPQKHINAAGRPAHPDLYSDEIPVALANLGARFEMCRKESRDLAAFLGWLRGQMALGCPVLVGVKSNPTRHPEWGLDHFVTAVATEGDAVVFNTTGGTSVSRTARQLASTEEGYGFANRFNAYYGIGILGQAGAGTGFAAVRLFVTREEADRLDVVVKCEGLEPGARYIVYRLASPAQKQAAPLGAIVSADGVYAFHDTIAPAEPALYRCRRIAPTAGGPGK